MRHLIVEGCDGTGKDTLISKLLEVFPNMRRHDRASHSLKGPVRALDKWVEDDNSFVNNGVFGPYIYNRHPLFSEPIYGPYRKDRPTHPAFTDSVWLSFQRAILAKNALLLIVSPPWAVVNDILVDQGPEAHMPGVYENRRHIYEAYRMLNWCGMTMRYNRSACPQENLLSHLSRVLGTN